MSRSGHLVDTPCATFQLLKSLSFSFHQNTHNIYAPLLTTNNKTRYEFNYSILNQFAQQTKRTYHSYHTSITSKEDLTPILRKDLLQLPENATEKLPTRLDLVLGMPLTVTQNNENGHLPLMNGTIGTLYSIVNDPDNQTVTLPNGVVRHKKPPLLIWIQTSSKLRLAPNFPQGLFPLFAVSQTVSAKFSASHSIKIKLHTLTVVPAFALTTEKCQGLTLKGCIVAPLLTIYRTSPQKTALYVALSRPTTIQNLHLCEPLTVKDLMYFRPPQQ